jgi:hypothetical protein
MRHPDANPATSRMLVPQSSFQGVPDPGTLGGGTGGVEGSFASQVPVMFTVFDRILEGDTTSSVSVLDTRPVGMLGVHSSTTVIVLPPSAVTVESGPDTVGFSNPLFFKNRYEMVPLPSSTLIIPVKVNVTGQCDSNCEALALREISPSLIGLEGESRTFATTTAAIPKRPLITAPMIAIRIADDGLRCFRGFCVVNTFLYPPFLYAEDIVVSRKRPLSDF